MTWGADLTAPARGFLDRRVWVDLDRLYGPPPADTPPRPDGLVLTRKVPGILNSWVRALDGRWIGVVDQPQLAGHHLVPSRSGPRTGWRRG
jgi:hypothetical protein